MSHETGPFDAETRGGDDLAVLLRLAGPREAPPAERLARLRSRAHADWQRTVTTRRRRRVLAWSLGGCAAVAGLVLALRGGRDVRPPAVVEPVVATVHAVTGTARLDVRESDHTVRAAAVGDGLRGRHDAVVTGAGVASLRLTGGTLLQVAGGTSVRLMSPERLALTEGRVYVETGGRQSLAVETPLGIVRDLGTRFEVRLTPMALRVRVRDGEVRLSRDRRDHDARPGDEVAVDAAGAVSRRTVAVDGPIWAWTTAAHAPFDIDGHTVYEFLAWLADEHDWELRFTGVAVEQKARATTLHGSVQGLTADQSLAAVLPASGMEHRRDGRLLTILLVDGGTR